MFVFVLVQELVCVRTEASGDKEGGTRNADVRRQIYESVSEQTARLSADPVSNHDDWMQRAGLSCSELILSDCWLVG